MLNFGRLVLCEPLCTFPPVLQERPVPPHPGQLCVQPNILLFAGVKMANLMTGGKDLDISDGFF